MSAEHATRWQHRPQTRPQSHWNADRTDTRPHPGPVSASCPLCYPEVGA